MICNRCINTLLTMMHPSHHGHQLHVPVKSIHSMLTNNLKSNQSPWLPLLVWRCNATTWKRGILMEQEKKKVVLKFATKNTKRTNRVYVWGNAVTGALGECKMYKTGLELVFFSQIILRAFLVNTANI